MRKTQVVDIRRASAANQARLLGHIANVVAISSQDNLLGGLYDDPQARLPPEATIQGVRVHRIATTHFGRRGGYLKGRGCDARPALFFIDCVVYGVDLIA
jgi:hypothetical protein